MGRELLPREMPFPVPDLTVTCLRCLDCCEVKEVADFPVRKDGMRSKVCRMCHDALPWRQEMAQRQAHLRKVSEQLFAGLADKRINAPHISELAAQLTAQWGGLSDFCRDWKNQVDQMIVAAKTVTDRNKIVQCYQAISKIIALSTQMRASASDMANLSDEDLQMELERTAARVMLEHDQAYGEDGNGNGNGHNDD